MSEDKNKSTQRQSEPSTEPNKEVPAPEVTFVLDHALPKVEKDKKNK